MNSHRMIPLLLVLLGLATLPAWPYNYIGRYNNAAPPNALIPARYDVSTLPNSSVTFFLSNQQPSAMSSGDSQEALVSEVALALSQWNNVTTSSLRLNFGGYFNQDASFTIRNPMGAIVLTSSLPPGAFAVGGPLYQIPAGSPSFLPVALSQVFLPLDMSLTSTSDPFFLTALTHEIGHSIGANHSQVAAVMLESDGTTRARVLTEDDVAMVSNLYPIPGYTSTTGSLSGRVTLSSGVGASIVGVAAFSDNVVIGAMTNPDGSFTINGLPPGNYRLLVQPLPQGAAPNPSADNPGDPDDLVQTRTLSNSVVSINTSIDSAFLGTGGAATHSLGAAATFAVSAGQAVMGANVSIGPRGSLGLEVNDTFTFPNATQFASLIWVRQGTVATVGFDGKHLDAPGLNFAFTNPGVSFVPNSFQEVTDPDSSDIFGTFAFLSIRASASATPGDSCVIYTSGGDTYFSAGHVRVVTSPPPGVTTVSPTNGATGATVTINGRNFVESTKVYFDGVPASITSNTGASLVVVAPPGPNGKVSHIFVANPDGQGSEFLADPTTFTYSAGPQSSIDAPPTSAAPGQALALTIAGTNTNFQPAMTVIGFGSGDVVVDSVTVQSSTSLTAQIHVMPTVGSASYDLTVVTGEEIETLNNVLTLKTQGPFTLIPFSGTVQAGAAGAMLASPVVIQAQDANGVPVSGVSVTFSIALGGGSVSPTNATTDSGGFAQTNVKLGPAAGVQIALASANQYTPAALIEIAGSTPTFGLNYSRAGDQQTGPVSTALPTSLTLTVLSNTNQPLPDIEVTWLVTAGGGSVQPLSAVTDSNGKVSARWTLGSLPGTQTIQAIPFYYSGVSIYGFHGTTFTATGISQPPNVPSNGIVNGAGFNNVSASLSPGAIASIFGTNLSNAPASGVQPGLVPGTSNLFVTSNGTTVTFEGVPAPLFFVSPNQLNVQVPFEVAGKTSSQVIVSINGSSASVTVPILPATPALFTVDSSGKGPAALLNKDGSANSASNPATAGSVIQLFGTGLGPVSPLGVTGTLAPSSPPFDLSTTLPTVTIGGITETAQFSALAPGFVGLWQINAVVPAGAGSGAVPLLLNAGGQNSNPVTVFLQ